MATTDITSMTNIVNVTGNAENINKETKDILDLLQEGSRTIQFSSYKNAVLVIGITGSGKSTFTQFIAGDNSHLRSQEVGKETGEFIIVDDNNRISNNSTLTSQTVFPELVVDEATNSAYYDCPGFSDTRSAAHEISATYFIKRVLDFAENVKFALLVNYSSVRRGVDRQDFLELIKHTTSLIKNIDKFKDSIVLVATKTDNMYTRRGKTLELVPDEKIIDNIARFLTEAKESLHNSKAYFPNEVAYHNAIKLIDILLTRNEANYTRLGIFRRPDEAGVLSAISLVQEAKKKLQKLLEKGIKFSPKVAEDFGYTVSDKSKLYINDLVAEINANIASEVGNIAQVMREHYRNQEEQINDLDGMREKIRIGYDTVSQLKTTIQNLNTPDELAQNIVQCASNLNITIPDTNISHIYSSRYFLEFFQTITEKKLKSYSLFWSDKVTGIAEYLKEATRIYEFLMNLYRYLSLYHIQKDVSVYKSANATQISDKSSMEQFIDIIGMKEEEYYRSEYESIRSMEFDRIKLGKLNAVVDATLNHKLQASCQRYLNKLEIRGRYIKLSEVINEDYFNLCSARVEVLEIFALEKVFFDADLVKVGQKLQVSIIAPQWEVIGSRKIVLDGKPGDAHPYPSAAGAWWVEGNGEHGKPGLPGGSAGNFLGIGDNFVNEGLLTVSANGGTGGPGQDGGNGGSGRDGEDMRPHYPKKNFWDYIPIVGCITRKNALLERASPSGSDVFWNGFVIQGRRPTRGGNGGNGGVGGKGGNNGKVTIVGLSTNPYVQVYNNNGEDGWAGNGGSGGMGGAGGVSVRVTQITAIECLDDVEEYVYETAASSGRWGTSGANANGIQYPEKPVEPLDQSHMIDAYKKYATEALSGNIRQRFLDEFLTKIDKVEYNNHHHHRRSINKNKFDDHPIHDHPALKSGTSSVYGSAIADGLFKTIDAARKTLQLFFNPVRQLKGWFLQIDRDARVSSTGTSLGWSAQSYNVLHSPKMKLSQELLADNFLTCNSAATAIDYSPFHFNDTLVLMDFIMKGYTKIKQSNCVDNDIKNDEDIEYVHRLAYNYYSR